MPLTIKLRFPAGRYHATPWGRHVNEGVAEWPPSPWRLLRALVAVWRRTCPDLSEAEVRRVLESLLGPPCFHLPASRVAHTRHFMPWEKKGPADRTLVFDTFVAVARDVDRQETEQPAESRALFIGWPAADLAPEDRAVLRKLLENMTFLGRAESWVHAELAESTSVDWNCHPADEHDPAPVRVLCADPATALGDEHYPTLDPKKLKKGIGAGDFLFDCPRWHLCIDTQTIHDRRWSGPPGTAWVTYSIGPVATTSSKTVGRQRPAPTFARFAIDGPVLPLVTETLPLAERLRSELLGRCKRLWNPADPRLATADLPSFAPAFWGKDDRRQPLKKHRHAFFLPVDEDEDGRIDHLAVFAPMGFGPTELRALDQLRRLRFGEAELALALVGLGQREDFARSRLLGPSAVWISATPFVVTRHLKRRGRKRDPREWSDGPEGRAAFVLEVLREEIGRRDDLGSGNLAGIEIEPIGDEAIGPRRPRTHEFRLHRQKPGDDGARRARGAFQIRFPRRISGPIALGHSCHFGLGLFLPPTSAAP